MAVFRDSSGYCGKTNANFLSVCDSARPGIVTRTALKCQQCLESRTPSRRQAASNCPSHVMAVSSPDWWGRCAASAESADQRTDRVTTVTMVTPVTKLGLPRLKQQQQQNKTTTTKGVYFLPKTRTLSRIALCVWSQPFVLGST